MREESSSVPSPANDASDVKLDEYKKLEKPLPYDAFIELLHALGVNPYEFRLLSGENVYGYFPDLKWRKPQINVEELAKVLWSEDV